MVKIFIKSFCLALLVFCSLQSLHAQLIPGTSSPTYQLTNTYLGPPQTVSADAYPCTDGNCTVYQWQKSTDGSTWSDITGAYGTSYNPGAYLPSVKTYYRMKATNGGTSQYATVDTVNVENCTITGPVD